MRRADQMTVAHLIAFLKARGHLVDLYCIETGARPSEDDIQWLEETCHAVHRYRHSLLSIALGIWQVPIKLLPLQVGLFANPFQRRDLLNNASSGAYDVVYTYYLRSAEISKRAGRTLRNGGKKPATILALQLSQTLNTRRIERNASNLFIKALYSVESRLVARYETRIWREFDRTVIIGERDVEAIKEECAAQGRPVIDNYFFGAHGTDVSRFGPKAGVEEEPNLVIFSGMMKAPTNAQAVQWFVRKVWARVLAEIPDARLMIVGREPGKQVRDLAYNASVEVTGTVDDSALCIAKAAVCINPMQAGGGMQNKLIEYLACQKAVVATTVANEGIKAMPGRDLLIADSPTEFADCVIRLLKDPVLRKKLGRSGREFVLRDWTWESHFLKLEKAFYDAISEKI
jgi:polysaccharide biosynthesis protein PslH